MKMATESIIPIVSKATKKDANTIRKAIDQGDKIVGAGVNNFADAKKIMEKQGIPPDFLDKIINNSHIATPYLNKFGIDEKTFKDGLNSLKTTQPTGSGRADPNHNKNGSSTFDKSKYRKV